MYHVELRQFPHNFCRFNLTERELWETVLYKWAQGEWIELGERKWNAHQAQLTVLEGPKLPVQQLSMGRGWRNACRQGRDVTEQLVAAARPVDGSSAGREERGADAPNAIADAPLEVTGKKNVSNISAAGLSAPDMRLVADSLGLALLAKFGEEAVPLSTVWQLARERYPEWTASDSLKLAEHTVRSLVGSRLAVVLAGRHRGEPEPYASDEQVEDALRAIDSWSGAPAPALIRKA